MYKIENSEQNYKRRLRKIKLTLIVEVVLTLAIAISVVLSGCSSLFHSAKQSCAEVNTSYNTLVRGYKTTFSALVIPIQEKIKENISAKEMSKWLQGNEKEYQKAFGTKVYDGIALTYKGQYVHSWDYGDYSDYDPNTRPWYQQAHKAKGKVTVVAPYVTFLNGEENNDDDAILMTIAQKYNDKISFDLDLKIKDIRELLDKKELAYHREKVLLYDKDGYILSSTNDKEFAHNLFNPDNVISKQYSEAIKINQNKQNSLQIESVDGSLQFMYFHTDENENTVCLTVPFSEIILHNFLAIFIIALIMFGFEIYLYIKNKKNALEYKWRDERLGVVADATFKERVYIDLDDMVFFGNDTAGNLCKNGTYTELYQLLKSRLVNTEDEADLDEMLSPDVVKKMDYEQFVMEARRYLMRMQNEDGSMTNRTIEVNRNYFPCDGKNMMCIAMRDASESVDLLQKSLKETELAKQESAEAFDRFMSYICMAQDGVEELNIKDHTITRYFMKDNHLDSNTLPYPEFPFHLFHEEDREKAVELYNEDRLYEMCQTQEASYWECRMKWNDAQEYHWCNVIVLGIPITEFNPFNVLILIKDVNELKSKEEAQKKALEDAFKMAEQGSEAKGSFLSKMSHEIRTPLNAIIGYLSIAKDSENDLEKINHCIDNSQIASKHLLQIINDVLDMSSIESGKMKIANEEFDLKTEITDITAIFYQNAKEKGVQFETHVDNLREEWLIGDQLRLNQVLMNLLSNAVKFTPEGGLVTLQITQLNPDEESSEAYIQFVVSDNGIGMSEEYLSRLFKPFEQENADTAKKYGGSGLGLSITNNLVNMMGGSITVESKQDEGTRFIITMHFQKALNHIEKKPRTEDYSHVRVLVVDDMENECSFIKSMLKRCGVKADSVTSGKDALKRLKGRAGSDYEYDMCILDWSMPEMNGVEVASKIREEFGDELPIIIATAYDVAELEAEANKAGVNKVIAKPLFQSTLFDLLVSSFGKYEPKSEDTDEKKKIDMTGLHVILAEDNIMNMDIAVTVLEKAGIDVAQAVNGQEAYDLFVNAPKGTYDLILMDVQMPVLDGYEATKKIRESGYDGANDIPIIAMTANAFAEDVTEALSKGMNAHIAKPINYDKMFKVLKQFSNIG